MSSDPNKKIKLLLACLDWRIHPRIENYFIKNNVCCDLCVTAGSVKDLIDPQTQDFFIKQIEISKKLHNCQGVILTMHLDCGAYGGTRAFENRESEIATAKNELQKAEFIVKENFSELSIEKYLIDLKQSGSEWIIEPESIC
jgi:hypothetical protein